jgi:hypothetical protein
MKTIWLKEAKTPQEREEIKKTILNSTFALDILRNIVYNIDIGLTNVSSEDYDNPSWSHKQAHINGRQETIREILAILDFTKGDDQSRNKIKKALTDDRTNRRK